METRIEPPAFIRNGKVVRETWRDTKNHRIVADQLGEKLGYRTKEDWYGVTVKDFVGRGRVVLRKYNDSPQQFLRAVYPGYKWDPWKFARLPKGYLDDKENQRILADWLGEELGYRTKEDWYGVTRKDFVGRGRAVLKKYNNSPQQFLRAVYPGYKWDPWKFASLPQGYLDDTENHRAFAERLREKLGCRTKEDWYGVTYRDFQANHGGGVLTKYNNSPQQFLRAVYPDYKWDPWKFTGHKTERKFGKWLEENKDRLSIVKIIHEYAPAWADRKRYDYLIVLESGIAVIIEIDGPQHYRQVWNWAPPEEQQANDRHKEDMAKDNGISAIRLNQEDILGDRNEWREAFEECLCVVVSNPGGPIVLNRADGRGACRGGRTGGV